MGVKGHAEGILIAKNREGWTEPMKDWLVLEKVKQFAASKQMCVAFAVHPTEGVEFYGATGTSPTLGHLPRSGGWQLYQWSSNHYYSAFYELEASAKKESEMPSILDVDDEDLEDYLQELFSIADENDDGVLEADEFRKLMSLSGFDFSQDTVEDLLRESDKDGNGVIDITELRAMVELLRKKEIEKDMPCITEVDDEDLEEYLEELFSIADENDDGTLQPEEFRKLMALSGFGFSEETVERLLKESDTDGDGSIDITELRVMVKKIKKDEADAIAEEEKESEERKRE